MRHRNSASRVNGPGNADGADARFSSCGRYRYWLMRTWGEGATVLFVMLNPSSADAIRNDPTLRRCINLARAWGYGRLEVVNLFAWRATHPKDLRQSGAPVGPANGRAVWQAVRRADLIVLAWGNDGALNQAGPRLLGRLVRAGVGPRLACLGWTLQGHPRHVLYVRKDTRPVIISQALGPSPRAEPSLI